MLVDGSPWEAAIHAPALGSVAPTDRVSGKDFRYPACVAWAPPYVDALRSLLGCHPASSNTPIENESEGRNATNGRPHVQCVCEGRLRGGDPVVLVPPEIGATGNHETR